jgi:uncharacterized protein (TIGR03663 family)
VNLSIKNVMADQRRVPVLIVIFTAVFRVILLAIKPPHFDEGVNGWFLDEMTHNGYFAYDPGNYHGPLHFYILFLFKALFGRNLWSLRLPVALLSTLTVWLVMKFDRFIDRRACWIAALAMAVSPGNEFYGRYAIHESELVLFLILAVWGFAGMWRFGGMQYLWAAALGVTGMILTKETYIMHLTAFALAAGCLWGLEKCLPGEDTFPRAQNAPPYSTRQWCIVGAVCAGLIVFFYSGTFLNPMFYSITWVRIHTLAWNWSFPMPEFLIKTFYEPFAAWKKTGEDGNGHEKTAYDIVHTAISFTLGKKPIELPIIINYYWLALIWRYEWPAVAGMFLSPFCICPKYNRRAIHYLFLCCVFFFPVYSVIHPMTPWHIYTAAWQAAMGVHYYEWMGITALVLIAYFVAPKTDRFIRYLIIYGWGAFAAYTIVKYKTPWCIITIIWPFYFVFGHFWAGWMDVKGQKWVAVFTAAVLLVASFGWSVRLSFLHHAGDRTKPYYTDEEEPYVYVQTFEDIHKLTDPLFQLVARDPANYYLKGHVIMDSTHPLPWVLGDFPNIGYYGNDEKLPASEEMDAAFLLVDDDREEEVQKSLKENYFVEDFHLRASLDPVKLYLNYNKFREFFPNRKPDFIQGIAAPAKTGDSDETP